MFYLLKRFFHLFCDMQPHNIWERKIRVQELFWWPKNCTLKLFSLVGARTINSYSAFLLACFAEFGHLKLWKRKKRERSFLFLGNGTHARKNDRKSFRFFVVFVTSLVIVVVVVVVVIVAIAVVVNYKSFVLSMVIVVILLLLIMQLFCLLLTLQTLLSLFLKELLLFLWWMSLCLVTSKLFGFF